MKWNELAELICAFISLFVTVIIGKKQSCQSKRMEELERRQDERDERRHAEGNKAQAIEFISKHYADRGLIRFAPLPPCTMIFSIIHARCIGNSVVSCRRFRI